MVLSAVSSNFRKLLYSSLLLLSVLVSGCGSDSTTTSAPEDHTTLYVRALQDASIASPAEVYTGLTPITVDNPHLIWENGPGSRVLMLSWIRTSDKKWYDGTADPACKPENCAVGVDLWVTVAPEMKNFFHGTVPSPLRIAQLLGVTPEAGLEERSFVELWVSPNDLFRPCPDPEITDRECQPSGYPTRESDFPVSLFWSFNPDEKVRATEGGVWEFRDYKGWFANRTQFIYSYPYPAAGSADRLPYPWTRLGYTYDWGNPNHIGLSEYVLHGKRIDQQGTPKTVPVGIRSIKSTAEYFSSP